MYGQAIISGKETRKCVKEVLDYLANEYADRLGQKFFPEKLFKDKTSKFRKEAICPPRQNIFLP